MLSYKQMNFIKTVGEIAQRDTVKNKILPSLTIAQAILESSWGNSGLSSIGKALFGIKANSDWKGNIYSGNTKECYDGKTFVNIIAGFRAYKSWEESVNDHSEFLNKYSRYKAVIGETDYKKASYAIHKAGYATDPSYAKSLINIIETYKLYKYDNVNKISNPVVKKITSVKLPVVAKKYSWIRNLQIALNKDGFKDANGNKLKIDDKIGLNTFSACPTIKRGSHNNTVKVLQSRLKTLGFYHGQIDGYCGVIMEEAIKKYQKYSANMSIPDGEFTKGKDCWTKITGYKK